VFRYLVMALGDDPPKNSRYRSAKGKNNEQSTH